MPLGVCIRLLALTLLVLPFPKAAVRGEEPAAVRARRDLLALYTFDSLEGRRIPDRSGQNEPLDLEVSEPDAVSRRAGGLGLESSTILRAGRETTRRVSRVLKQSGELTLEVWLVPESLDQQGPARILTISSDTSHRNVTLGQQGSRFDIRLRTTRTSDNGLPSLATPEGTLRGRLTHVVFTRDSEGTARCYVDGRQVATARFEGDFSNWNDDYPLAVGNELTGDRPWRGELHLVALYGRALTEAEVKANYAAGTPYRAKLAERLPPRREQPVDFVRDVQPILRERCFECHAAGNEEGGLNLAVRSRLREGGQSGPVLVAGDSLSSPLLERVVAEDAARRMPPEGEPLSGQELAILRTWIDSGAAWPDGADVLDPRLEKARAHWAFQRLQPVTPPGEPSPDETPASSQTPASSREQADPVSPIDRFIRRGLRQRGLAPSPPLDARRLARRLYFDLVGLPPTPEELDAFAAAAERDRAGAVEELVDRLLASRHYGERWGRHWLDVARYADSDGQEADRDRPEAYAYRDFVIQAFNQDLPFDTFVRWQLAGDEYEPRNPQAVAATGFLTAGPHTVLADTFLEEERLRNRYNELDDIVSTLGQAMLGLTLGCARCHDHKYDALSAREYYRLLAAFHGGDRKTVTLPDGGQALVFDDLGAEPRTTWLFRRGDFYDREQQVRLGFPQVLTTAGDAETYWRAARQAGVAEDTSYQRRALAEWITDVDQGAGPLVARVLVNRVWQYHFGAGLVRTTNDFGVRGEAPSHPELLEWLAWDFVQHGWRLKRLHRLIVCSDVYQQATGFDPQKAQRDPENRLLWRRRPRRLEAEVLRDAMLAVGGVLNREPYGPAFKPPIPAEAIVARNLKDGGYPAKTSDAEATRRRSVYMFHKRVVPFPLFQVFDRPDALQSCGRRETTTVAPQALALLNDRLVRNWSEAFAARLLDESGGDNQRLVRRGFQLALGRDAAEDELQAAARFLDEQARRRATRQPADGDRSRREAVTDFCQALFGLNECLYVD